MFARYSCSLYRLVQSRYANNVPSKPSDCSCAMEGRTAITPLGHSCHSSGDGGLLKVVSLKPVRPCLNNIVGEGASRRPLGRSTLGGLGRRPNPFGLDRWPRWLTVRIAWPYDENSAALDSSDLPDGSSPQPVKPGRFGARSRTWYTRTLLIKSRPTTLVRKNSCHI
jgi:hypothetical protein